MRLKLKFSDKHSKDDDKYLYEQLKKHNSEIIKRDNEPVSLYYKDENGEIIAGLTGKTQWGSLLIEILWVHQNYRSRSLGAKLLAKAESIAQERKCQTMVVETMGFQAKAFYQKNDFKVFGAVENTNPKLNCFYMKKDLSL
ncbi:GNAT family N-acetyltransferase [Kangiella sp. HZ709]|nr:GNAT family N-acetyltransferase [Kangiella sp. HZ709]